MSSVVGEESFGQCLPPSVVRRMVPLRPAIQQILLEGAEPARKSATTGIFWRLQFAPASTEPSTIPAGERRQTTVPLGEGTRTGLRDARKLALSREANAPARVVWDCSGVTAGLPATPSSFVSGAAAGTGETVSPTASGGVAEGA